MWHQTFLSKVPIFLGGSVLPLLFYWGFKDCNATKRMICFHKLKGEKKKRKKTWVEKWLWRPKTDDLTTRGKETLFFGLWKQMMGSKEAIVWIPCLTKVSLWKKPQIKVYSSLYQLPIFDYLLILVSDQTWAVGCKSFCNPFLFPLIPQNSNISCKVQLYYLCFMQVYPAICEH